jgi:hypothetical protein
VGQRIAIEGTFDFRKRAHCPKTANVTTSLHDSEAAGPGRCFSAKPCDWQKSSIITYSVGSQGIWVHQRGPCPYGLGRQAHCRGQDAFLSSPFSFTPNVIDWFRLIEAFEALYLDGGINGFIFQP